MKLTVDLDGLTWSELYSFVDAARAAGVAPDTLVEQVAGTQDEDLVVGLSVTVDDLSRRTITLSPEDRASYARSLSKVLEENGDARAQLGDLESLRDLLVEG